MPLPANDLDLLVEFGDGTNGHKTPAGASLVGALTHLAWTISAPPRKTTCSSSFLAAIGPVTQRWNPA